MAKGKDPPGLISYIDTTLDAVRGMTNEEAGYFYRSMLEYADHRAEPDFSNYPGLRHLWHYVRAQINRDIVRYHIRSLKGAWGAYKRDFEKQLKGTLDEGKVKPLEFEVWYLSRPDLSDPLVDEEILKNVGDMSIAMTEAAREADAYYNNLETARERLEKWRNRLPGWKVKEAAEKEAAEQENARKDP